LNIAINTRLLIKDKLEGIGWFSFEVLYRIVKSHPEHQFYFIFDRPFSEDFIFGKNVTPIVLSPQARHPILYKIWFNYRIPSILKKYSIDVFLSPDGFLSLRTKTPQIPVIHDLNFEHYPEDLPKKDSRYYRRYMPLFAHKAAHILTVSEFSKHDIHAKYSIELSKISVAYNGVGDEFKPINEDELFSAKSTYSEGFDYFVYIGALHKRKNIERMLLAFDQFKNNHPSTLKFVIVGAKLFKDNSIEKVYTELKHKRDIIFTGRLPKNKLVKVTAAANALIYVSYFEGFGIPILEAMKCGVPVLTSNVTSMPEVAGNAAILVDPFSVDAIAMGMEKIVTPTHCQKLSISGIDRSNDFNWNTTAEKVWEAITTVSKKQLF
jgi:glycosyltransferase involved in cell wall biosynthesis